MSQPKYGVEAIRLANEEISVLRQRVEALEAIRRAAENLVAVKGRFHSEQAYQALVAALAPPKENSL